MATGERNGVEVNGGDANFHRQYDRQIRLWGLAAQQRMTSASRAPILVVLSSAQRFPRSCPWRLYVRSLHVHTGSTCHHAYLYTPSHRSATCRARSLAESACACMPNRRSLHLGCSSELRRAPAPRPEKGETDAVRGADARVLVCGMCGLAAETCKNIVLAGASRHTCPSPCFVMLCRTIMGDPTPFSSDPQSARAFSLPGSRIRRLDYAGAHRRWSRGDDG
jgi:hypothetical protein